MFRSHKIPENSRIKLHKVNLGPETIEIPVAEFIGKPGKTILVTAGMDGDEYVGIEAAYQLIETYKDREINGRLIIIPIVNIPGFSAETSTNPLDLKYPKHFYPGKPNGIPTERLIDWLDRTFIRDTDLWLDLHSGSLNEHLVPCILSYETVNRSLNTLSEKIIASLGAPVMVYEKPHAWVKTERLSRANVAYFIFESGTNGSRDHTDIDRHISWTEKAFQASGLISAPLNIFGETEPAVWRKIGEYLSPADGLWYPQKFSGENIAVGELLGIWRSLDLISSKRITSSQDGIILWGKKGLHISKGESLVAIASERG
jgi:uncharacterized protein